MLCTYPCTLQVHEVFPASDVLFAGHRAQAVCAPLTENEPAAHCWHAVDVPSRKYWPAVQHAPLLPSTGQRLVVPAEQDGVAVQALISYRLSRVKDAHVLSGSSTCTLLTMRRKYLAGITLEGVKYVVVKSLHGLPVSSPDLESNAVHVVPSLDAASTYSLGVLIEST